MLGFVVWCGVGWGLVCGRSEMDVLLREEHQRLGWVRGSSFSGSCCGC